tara:strand:- start:80642 stop:81421 length:780 start_codon:yes stop_codon:yes gene_type:complete
MKKITFLSILLTVLTVSFSFGQNLISDGTFDTQTGAPSQADATITTPWSGYNSQFIGEDNISLSRCANINNNAGQLYQVIDNVTPGTTYTATFDYRFVSGNGGYVASVNVRDSGGKTGDNIIEGFTPTATADQWFTDGSITFTVPDGITTIRLQFVKNTGNRPFRFDNVVLTETSTASVEDLSRFNFSLSPNPTSKYLNISASEKIDKVEVFNIVGQKVMTNRFDASQKRIDVGNLSKGIYIIKTYIGDAIGSKKFIKE